MRRYIPEIVGWELTLRCNLQCVHCGSAASPETVRSCELTLPECKTVVKELVQLGTKRITLTGGEPFLCEHWEPLAHFITEQSVDVQFVSNGVLITDALAQRLQDLPGRVNVGVSLDGAVAETHDSIRNCPGLFTKVLNVFERLKDHDIPVAVITTVHRDNFSELEALYKILSRAGIYAWQIQMAMPIGRMSCQQGKILTGGEALQLARFIARIRGEGNLRVETADNLGYYNSLETALREQVWTGCSAGMTVMGIRSNGDITGCLSLLETEPEGNVRDRHLSEIWLDPDSFSYNRKFSITDLKGECVNCPYGDICRGGCSFLCQSLTGQYHNNPLCLRLVDEDPDSVILVG